jgi:hypothetical protein
MTATPPDIIEGDYRVVSISPLAPRPSPNRRRAAARIVFWNMAVATLVVALPMLL